MFTEDKLSSIAEAYLKMRAEATKVEAEDEKDTEVDTDNDEGRAKDKPKEDPAATKPAEDEKEEPKSKDKKKDEDEIEESAEDDANDAAAETAANIKKSPEAKAKDPAAVRKESKILRDMIDEMCGRKKKDEAMDPVGKGDADIDNDGDEDESDEYLKNRRKAISKSVKNEEVELDEAFKKGDSVTVKNARKYDSLAKPTVSGKVIGMNGSKVMVQVGSGQMNVDPKDLMKESAELDEAYTKQQIMKMRQMLGREGQANKKKGVEIFMDKVKVDKNRATAMWKAAMTESVELDEALEKDGPNRGKLNFKLAKGKKGSEYEKKKAKQRQDMNKKNDPGADKKGLAISVLDKAKAKAKAKKKGVADKLSPYDYLSGQKPNKMMQIRIGLTKEQVELDEAFSDKEIKMAYGIINDPRYKSGNMTEVVKKIEQIAKGLSKHPGVQKALKVTNEDTE